MSPFAALSCRRFTVKPRSDITRTSRCRRHHLVFFQTIWDNARLEKEQVWLWFSMELKILPTLTNSRKEIVIVEDCL